MNLETILAEIDAEIARLQSAKALLSSVAIPTIRKRGGLAKMKSEMLTPAKSPKRRTMSAEARERIRQAQLKRWAATKKVAKPNLNATAAPLPKAKKKTAKSAAA
ncbi:MAG: hypothetical protein KGL64_08940 [Acidobacteriota bacterium]|nr:hypothetical protein [Acidobacteriota bacterium]